MPFDIAKDLAPDAPTAWHVECGQHQYRVLALHEDDYKVAVNPSDSDDEDVNGHDTLAMCNRITDTIYLRLEYGGEAVSLPRLRINLLHEVLHAVWGFTGMRQANINEEDAVSCLDSALLDVLTRNPWLLDALNLREPKTTSIYDPFSAPEALVTEAEVRAAFTFEEA